MAKGSSINQAQKGNRHSCGSMWCARKLSREGKGDAISHLKLIGKARESRKGREPRDTSPLDNRVLPPKRNQTLSPLDVSAEWGGRKTIKGKGGKKL